MLSKAKIKLIRSLKMGKFRKQHGLFIAEGTTNVLDFLLSGTKAEYLFGSEEWIAEHGTKVASNLIRAVSVKEMKQISSLSSPSGILAVFRIPELTAPDLKSYAGLLLMLEDIRDPGNLGTIIRTADWFGINHIVCSEETVDAFNPKVVQASMGSLARVEVTYCHLESYLESKPADLPIYGAMMEGEILMEVPKPRNAILMIGNEARGISSELLPFLDHQITIPQVPGKSSTSAESLNASVAAAIICYDFRRSLE
jgi:TrmH family RNA methyltransferase